MYDSIPKTTTSVMSWAHTKGFFFPRSSNYSIGNRKSTFSDRPTELRRNVRNNSVSVGPEAESIDLDLEWVQIYLFIYMSMNLIKYIEKKKSALTLNFTAAVFLGDVSYSLTLQLLYIYHTD